MIHQALKTHLLEHGIRIQNIRTVSGGDISDAYLILSSEGRFFLKVNSGKDAPHMFATEQMGLELLAQADALATPKVILSGKVGTQAFILMQYIESKRATPQDMEQFGLGLAQLHQYQEDTFGWDQNNFIGSLPQSNQKHSNWSSFYWEERMLPQLQMAHDSGLLPQKEIPKWESVKHLFDQVFQETKASLLHGDLWSGNYLISTQGQAFLIDPAVYFGHHEVDIAMSKLFGGFGNSFYDAYYSIWPKIEAHSIRIDLFQLYYLLVHLNLFGSSYYLSVSNILRRYF